MIQYRRYTLVWLLAALLVLFSVGVTAEPTAFKTETVVSGLRSPWGMAFLPNGDILVTEQSGQLKRIRDGKLLPDAIMGVPKVVARGQGGLLDIVIDPNFAENQQLYLSYSGRGENGIGTEVARATLDNNRLVDVKVIFRAQPKTRGSAHYGSRLLFANDGTLYISLGDRYSYLHEAQTPANHLGTVVRIDSDGSIPKDNPFVNDSKAAPEVFSYGHRNVQGLALHPVTGEVWSHEHGPRGGDELNHLKPGVNYGWPAITYGIDYSGAIISDQTRAPGMAQPVTYWDPSIAPSGMAFYNGNAFPAWRGNIFIGSLKFNHLRRLVLDEGKVIQQEVLLQRLDERIRDVRIGPDDFIYVLTDEYNGKLVRLVPAG